ncbi:MAG: PQQ-binding-like beta-propeller repeat protein [Acidobacteriota bacterium]|nr:PQQ-binding-like beta-propeller repeat protein [Acidobacteriota bacterium]
MLLRTALLLLAAASLAAGDQITGWRTDGTGSYMSATPPTVFDAEKNVVWKTAMPDWSNAQAIIVGDKIFVNSEPSTLVCVDRKSGKILWQKPNEYTDILSDEEIAKLSAGVQEKAKPIRAAIAKVKEEMAELRKAIQAGDEAARGRFRGKRLQLRNLDKQLNEIDPLNIPNRHDANGYSSAVPTSDGKHVFVVYGNGVAAAYDLEGNRKWAHVLDKPTHGWGHSASPLLVGDKVVFHILDVVAIEKNTGKELWRTESKEGWGGPVTFKVGGEDMILTATHGDILRAEDGKILAAKAAGLKFATPVIHNGILYCIEKDARAYKLPTDPANPTLEKIWSAKIKGSRHYASSVIHGDLIYAVSREGWMNVLEKDTGKVVYEHELGISGNNQNSIYPSVSVAGGHIYIGSEEGTVLVVKPGRQYEQVARNQLEKFRGTPIFDGKRMYVRGLSNLYCLGE